MNIDARQAHAMASHVHSCIWDTPATVIDGPENHIYHYEINVTSVEGRGGGAGIQ
jgi:hypothetical protein